MASPDQRALVTDERAAILTLLARRPTPRKHLAGTIEEQGALHLLEIEERGSGDRLFPVESPTWTIDDSAKALTAWHEEGIRMITVVDEDYPANLRMVYDRPPALFVQGQLTPDDERSVAIVGTRTATPQGLDSARAIAQELSRAGYVVVSGLAAGIDTAAHTATLDSGGRTVAVIGNGLHHAFPKANAALQARLATEHAVVSQFLPDQEPRKWTFPLRNAVMSGLARATIVIEAAHTSGARMQARLAIEHGRPAFLLRSLVEQHQWAKSHAQRPGVYVINHGYEVVERLERLYASRPALVA